MERQYRRPGSSATCAHGSRNSHMRNIRWTVYARITISDDTHTAHMSAACIRLDHNMDSCSRVLHTHMIVLTVL